jgi:hypothetical protein
MTLFLVRFPWSDHGARPWHIAKTPFITRCGLSISPELETVKDDGRIICETCLKMLRGY